LRITPTETQSRKCELCGVYKSRSIFYDLIPHPAIIKLLNTFESRIVCNICAIREEFGGKYKQNSRYKEWINEK